MHYSAVHVPPPPSLPPFLIILLLTPQRPLVILQDDGETDQDDDVDAGCPAGDSGPGPPDRGGDNKNNSSSNGSSTRPRLIGGSGGSGGSGRKSGGVAAPKQQRPVAKELSGQPAKAKLDKVKAEAKQVTFSETGTLPVQSRPYTNISVSTFIFTKHRTTVRTSLCIYTEPEHLFCTSTLVLLLVMLCPFLAARWS